jgi:hypothetical protein
MPVSINNLSIVINANAGSRVGALAATASNAIVDNVTISGTALGINDVGGLIGVISESQGGRTIIKNSVNNATIDCGEGSYIGGLIGRVTLTDGDFKLIDSRNHGGLWGDSYTGGLVGAIASSSAQRAAISGAVNTATIAHNNSHIGGIAGSIERTDVTNSIFTAGEIGNLPATSSTHDCSNIGGIAGYASESSIFSCMTTGEIDIYVSIGGVNVTGIGGIVGVLDANSSITDSYSTGTIYADIGAGGIAGLIYASTTITRTYSTSNISGVQDLGGLVGIMDSSDPIPTLDRNVALNASISARYSYPQNVDKISGTRPVDVGQLNYSVRSTKIYEAGTASNMTRGYRGVELSSFMNTDFVDLLGFSEEIWDLSGARPTLKGVDDTYELP